VFSFGLSSIRGTISDELLDFLVFYSLDNTILSTLTLVVYMV